MVTYDSKVRLLGSHDLLRIENTLLSEPIVEDCVVTSRLATDAQPLTIAYVVTSHVSSPDELKTIFQNAFNGQHAPDAYVPVTRIPLNAQGHVDDDALMRLEILDPHTAEQWEKAIKQTEGVQEAAVLIRETRHTRVPLHLDDLRPERSANPNGPQQIEPDSKKTHQGRSESSTANEPSLVQGDALNATESLPATMAKMLESAAQRSADLGVTYLRKDGSAATQCYPKLLEEAQRIFNGLRRLGLKPGDVLLFQLEAIEDFIPAFWACQLGGLIPVPVPIAPRYEPSNAVVQKLLNAWKLFDKPIVLTRETLAVAIASAAKQAGVEGFTTHPIEPLRRCDPVEHVHCGSSDDPVLMLLTSGSTGQPKAVIHTHRTLIARSAGTAQLNGFQQSDITLNWMPLDHVGGLVMFHVRDVYTGCQQIHAPIEAVLEDPLTWLDWIERYKATVTWAPNFAYGLINDRSEEIAQRRWDLSSMRFILNAGEAIVAKTARRFLKLLASHSLSADCMHPAWGMSETASAVTYSNGFIRTTTSDTDRHVEVGQPIPGFGMRIVDSQGQMVHEGVIGRLQVKGVCLTPGYHQNSALNAEVFTEDGWFKTGDLGFIRRAQLTITGREKDEIIINGVNFIGAEIETVVDGIDGVWTSFSAVCAARATDSDTDELVIFFCPTSNDERTLKALLKDIRHRVGTNVGITPTYLIPLDREQIPKTSIGKIQRRLLKERFETGQFKAITKQIDLLTENNNTMPDWFFRKTWHPKAARYQNVVASKDCTLVFGDQDVVLDLICRELQATGQVVRVNQGARFEKLGSDSYRINPREFDDYVRLLESLRSDGKRIDRIIHAWSYRPTTSHRPSGSLDDLSTLLPMMQALSRVWVPDHPIRCLVVSNDSQFVVDADDLSVDKSMLLSIVKTANQEWAWMDGRYVDLTWGDPQAAQHLLYELSTHYKDQEIAYRQGQRFVRRLEKVSFDKTSKQSLPFQKQGLYLISGGLGGIGFEFARYLLQQFDARLVLIGRTPLPDESRWDEFIEDNHALGERLRRYRALRRISPHCVYESADICDSQSVQDAVQRSQTRWDTPLRGAVHLAGTFHERTLDEETPQSMSAALAAKTRGALVLHRILEERGGGIFISFGSVAGFFGGAAVGAYAAGNAFFNGLTHWQNRHTSVISYCYDWSTWDEVGMSRGYGSMDLARARGYYAMSPDQAMGSLLVALCHDQRHLLIGLDEHHPFIRSVTEHDCYQLQSLVACYSAEKILPEDDCLTSLSVRDRVGTASRCRFVRLPDLPRSADGQIDRDALAAELSPSRRRDEAIDLPQTEAEHKIAQIWKEVLGTQHIDTQENFFGIGGNSLKATQILSRLREVYPVSLSLRDLFEHATIGTLARLVEGSAGQQDPQQITPIDRIDPQTLLTNLDQLSDEKVASLLAQIQADGGLDA